MRTERGRRGRVGFASLVSVVIMAAAGCQSPPDEEGLPGEGDPEEVVEQPANIDEKCENQCEKVCRFENVCQTPCNVWEEHPEAGYKHCRATTCGSQSGLPCLPGGGDLPGPQPPVNGGGGGPDWCWGACRDFGPAKHVGSFSKRRLIRIKNRPEYWKTFYYRVMAQPQETQRTGGGPRCSPRRCCDVFRHEEVYHATPWGITTDGGQCYQSPVP